MDTERKIFRAEIVEIVLIVLVILLVAVANFYYNINEGKGEKWNTPADLNGKTFVSTVGSSYASMIEELFPDSEIIYVQDWADEDMFVTLGKADALLVEQSSCEFVTEVYPELVCLEEPVGRLECRFSYAGTQFGEQLRDEINEYLAMIEKDGTMAEIWDKWDDPNEAPDHIDVPLMEVPSRGTVHVATSLDWPPMAYQSGDQPVGYFIELGLRFCAYAGYEPELENVTIQSALAGIGTGKYDWICYGMVQTPEATDVYFSTPLYSEPVYVVINKSNYGGYTEDEEEHGSFVEEFFEGINESFTKNFIVESRWKMLLSGLGVTAMLSILSGIFGTLLGAAVCALRMSSNTYATAFGRIYIKTVRGIPIMVTLMIIYYVVFGRSSMSAFWACVIGFSVDFSAYCAEIMRSGIEAVPYKQTRAAVALGFSGRTAFRKVVIPQAVVHILPVYVGQFISMVKMTSVAGYISVEDLTKISDIIRSRTYEAFFPLIFSALVYFLLAVLLTSLLKILQQRVDPALRPRTIKGVDMHDT